MPMTLEVVSTNGIKVISARKKYENRYPGEYHRWKVETFLDLMKEYDKDVK